METGKEKVKMARILGVCASTRHSSHTSILVNTALEAAKNCGAEVKLLDLRATPLPIYDADREYEDEKNVRAVLELVEWADGFIVGSPEYHGCMSGAAKNFFDFHYREFGGKLFGLVCATGGSQGV
ncbi:MAG: NAD(P)H-dependent oxidoreductase, partial [Candidatus Sumerlaeaceae bacterium]|nr:NAD(P)H-dependent oxidoreductase [Candidatus Sumerlaeaceae bacterium]